MQWVLVALIGLLVLAAIFYFGRDARTTVTGTAPADVTVVEAPAA
jgi:multidrug efflux pump subunit AcrA (membrane-fusion protein)